MNVRRLLLFLFAGFALGLAPPGFGQTSATVTGTACTAGIDVSKQATIGIQVTGSWSGTIQPEVSIAGQAPVNVQVTPSTSSSAQSTITANGVYTATVSGYTRFFLCGNTVTGTATVYFNVSTTSSLGRSSTGGGGGGSGTVTGVLGTTNQITSDGSSTTPTLSIPSTFIAPGTISATTSIDATKLSGNLPAISGASLTSVNAATLGSATFAAPGAIGGGTPSTGAFTAITGTSASLGTDASVNGTLTLANGAGGGAHNIFGSAATTTNTILGFATAPTTGHIVTCTTSGTTCTLTDGGAAGGGSGTVNSGTTPRLAYYASSTTAVSDVGANLTWASPTLTIGVAGTTTGNLALASSTATGSVTLAPASAASAVTVTIPAATDTLVNLAGTQALTNKTLDGVTSTVMGYVDPTSSIQTQLNAKGTSTLSGLTTGSLPKAASASTLANSLLDDGVTTANTLTYTGTAGIAAPAFTITGASGVSGVVNWGQGTKPSSATTAITEYAPTSVTSYFLAKPGAAATGLVHWTNSAGTVTETISAVVDADLSGAIAVAHGGTNATSAPSAGAIPDSTSTTAVSWTVTPTLGLSGTAGTLAMFPASGNFTTTWGSAATTSNTILGFVAAPTTGHMVDCTTSSTTCTLHDSGVVTANVVNASSPGAGIAHFAGSTQTVTSSAIVAADITSATITGTQLAASLALTTPNIGAATGTSLLVTGLMDGTVPIGVSTGASCNLGATSGCLSVAYNHAYQFNQEGTAGTGVTYTLPATALGKQYCVANSGTTGVVNIGVLTVYPPASSYIIYNGAVNTVGGGGTHGIASGGAAGDAACFVAIDSTHWQVYVQSGTWTVN